LIGHFTKPDRVVLDLHHEEVPGLTQNQAPEPATLQTQDAELPENLSLITHRGGPGPLAPSGDPARPPVHNGPSGLAPADPPRTPPGARPGPDPEPGPRAGHAPDPGCRVATEPEPDNPSGRPRPPGPLG